MFQGKVFRMEDFSVLLFPVFVNVTSFINNKIVFFFYTCRYANAGHLGIIDSGKGEGHVY